MLFSSPAPKHSAKSHFRKLILIFQVNVSFLLLTANAIPSSTCFNFTELCLEMNRSNHHQPGISMPNLKVLSSVSSQNTETK